VKSSTGHRRQLKCTTLTHPARTGSSASPDRPALIEHMGSLHQRVLLIFVINTTRGEKYVHLWSWRTASPSADQQPASPSRCIRLLQNTCACSGDHLRIPVPAQDITCGAAPPSAACIQLVRCARCVRTSSLGQISNVLSWHSFPCSSEYCSLTGALLRSHRDLLSLRLCCAWEKTHVD